ncbi:S8 family serine peptidase [Nonomuraea sp. NBC_01738]|uniref:S8 family serine peptidase n=1 Tax=Nonomuraea sp. NBC_01738 TaxID=2976003 RepID=UPI002E0FA309|nr:S8 family serine peptidase [Nonomuraea sp. NBC_01738]
MHWSAHVTAAGVVTAALLSSPLPAAAAEPAAGSVHRVTLITGDVVTVRQAVQGRNAVEVKPGPGRERMGFHTTEENGELRVLPNDIVPFLAAKRLDPSLFSVTRLIAQGYDDAKTDKLPLLFLYDGSAPKSATAPELESVNGRVVAADKRTIGQLWKSLDEQRATLSQGVARIWLDARVKATLDHSVPQVGAPEAWQAGFDGKGVKVAVLDTGVDAAHPDLAGRVKQTKVFTGEASVQDGNGHGTHVASTIAGGDGRKGVAPGAELMVGKVLGDDGSGTLSGVIEGMEWAAAEGASVINMSLGGGATDGTDPLSVAVDTLTERTGALFVVAAGNDGSDYSIGTPGAATSALTVGAVDGKDALAEFSSRGPRLDDAPKPDLTAPGVAIVAARAAGTTMGEPVDERYTAASGTSMATPHVAGAAAIVKQRHPDWTARQIKDALVGSAKPIPGQRIDDAGAGRLDVARAVRQGVTATGVVDLGKHQQDEGPATAVGTITYTNGTAAPVTLDLATTLEGAELSAKAVTVAAGGTADVKVTTDLAKLAFGRYGGLVTATAGAEQVHTTLTLTWKGPQHTVRFTAIDAAGEQSGADTLSMFGATQQDDLFTWLPAQGLTVEVSEGTYMTQSLNLSGGWGRSHPRSGIVVIPELKVDRDLDVVIDFRKTTPVTVKTKEPAEQVGIYTFFTYRAFGARKISQGAMNFDVVDGLNVSPTQPVSDGTFEFASRWQLVAPRLTARLPGTAQPYSMGFLGRSPGVEGRHLWRLADGAAGSMGKAAVIRSEDIDWADPSGAAIKAGAVAVILVMSPDDPFGRDWKPAGADLPIPALVVSADDGRKMLERIAKGNAKLEVTGQMDSPYLYDVMQVSEGRVPDKVVYEVNDGNTARVATTYADNGGFAWTKEQRFGWRPWQSYALGQQMETQRIVKTPLRRTEYVSANGSFWQHLVNHQYVWDDMGRLLDGMTEQPRTYRPGARISESWNAPVVRPAIPAWMSPSIREGDTMQIRIPEFVDSSGHVSRTGVDNDTASARFYRDGTLVAERDEVWGGFPASPQEAAYRLELSTKRTSEEWNTAPATETAWTFRSKPGDRVLPLLQVDYDVRPERPGLVGFAVRHQEGVSGARAKDLRLELSYDDGATWRKQPVIALGGGRYSALVLRQHPSLRVTATDSAGNTVEQTVIRAY